jgi:hypothetical protein
VSNPVEVVSVVRRSLDVVIAGGVVVAGGVGCEGVTVNSVWVVDDGGGGAVRVSVLTTAGVGVADGGVEICVSVLTAVTVCVVIVTTLATTVRPAFARPMSVGDESAVVVLEAVVELGPTMLGSVLDVEGGSVGGSPR